MNFVTCHDGFTLNDLVSYNEKHNEANGENNGDGANDNRSWNCGVEGPTDDPAIEAAHRQVKNLLTVTMISLGMPMILMGDESAAPSEATTTPIARTTSSAGSIGRLGRSIRTCCASCSCSTLGGRCETSTHVQSRTSLKTLLGEATKSWHGVVLGQPDWSDDSRSVALSAEVRSQQLLLHFNTQCFLGTARVRTATTGRRGPLATLDRHVLESSDDIVPWREALSFVAAPTSHRNDQS